MGYLGITLGIETARGEYAEPYIDSGFKLVTKENILSLIHICQRTEKSGTEHMSAS